MELKAITREVSTSVNNCQLSFHAREPIDVAKQLHSTERIKIVSPNWVFGSFLFQPSRNLTTKRSIPVTTNKHESTRITGTRSRGQRLQLK